MHIGNRKYGTTAKMAKIWQNPKVALLHLKCSIWNYTGWYIFQLSLIIASQSRNIYTEVQNYQNCDLVKNVAKNGQNYAIYSSFGLTKRTKKFETIWENQVFSQWFHMESPCWKSGLQFNELVPTLGIGIKQLVPT